MTDLHEKLHQFRTNWLVEPYAAAPLAEPMIGFRCFADDTPRFPEEQAVSFWPTPVEMPSDLPRFANCASQEAGQRAA